MLIPVRDLQLIAEGRITVAFRRWVRPTVKAGGTIRTAVGVLAIESVDAIAERDILEADASAAGFSDVEALRAALNRRREGSLCRVRLRLQGPDPRATLRANAEISEQEVESRRVKLARLDKNSEVGPWTLRTLEAVRNNPRCRAADLALRLGLHKDWLKVNIRKLKELGLTESLDVGYRLSSRGETLVSLTARGDA